MKILIVDDNKNFLTTLVYRLRRTGHDAEGTLSGLESLNFLNKNLYEILISDINMPEMNGFELADAVSNKYPELRILLMSSSFENNAEMRYQFWNKNKGIEILEEILHSLKGETDA